MNSPIITKMEVIPVAGYDSMLMSLSEAHAPWFTRNLVVLTDSLRHQGIGEIHGGDYTCESLRACIPFVEGQEISRYRKILQIIHRNAQKKMPVTMGKASRPWTFPSSNTSSVLSGP